MHRNISSDFQKVIFPFDIDHDSKVIIYKLVINCTYSLDLNYVKNHDLNRMIKKYDKERFQKLIEKKNEMVDIEIILDIKKYPNSTAKSLINLGYHYISDKNYNKAYNVFKDVVSLLSEELNDFVLSKKMQEIICSLKRRIKLNN